jgi:hypothetical protein
MRAFASKASQKGDCCIGRDRFMIMVLGKQTIFTLKQTLAQPQRKPDKHDVRQGFEFVEIIGLDRRMVQGSRSISYRIEALTAWEHTKTSVVTA